MILLFTVLVIFFYCTQDILIKVCKGSRWWFFAFLCQASGRGCSSETEWGQDSDTRLGSVLVRLTALPAYACSYRDSPRISVQPGRSLSLSSIQKDSQRFTVT